MSNANNFWPELLDRLERGLTWLVNARSLVRQQATDQQVTPSVAQIKEVQREVQRTTAEVRKAIREFLAAAENGSNDLIAHAEAALEKIDVIEQRWSSKQIDRAELFGRSVGFKERTSMKGPSFQKGALTKKEQDQLLSLHEEIAAYLSTSEARYAHDFHGKLALIARLLSSSIRNKEIAIADLNRLEKDLEDYAQQKVEHWSKIAKISALLE